MQLPLKKIGSQQLHVSTALLKAFFHTRGRDAKRWSVVRNPMVTHDHFKDLHHFSQARKCGANQMIMSRVTFKSADKFDQHSKYINLQIMRTILLLPKQENRAVTRVTQAVWKPAQRQIIVILSRIFAYLAQHLPVSVF